MQKHREIKETAISLQIVFLSMFSVPIFVRPFQN